MESRPQANETGIHYSRVDSIPSPLVRTFRINYLHSAGVTSFAILSRGDPSRSGASFTPCSRAQSLDLGHLGKGRLASSASQRRRLHVHSVGAGAARLLEVLVVVARILLIRSICEPRLRGARIHGLFKLSERLCAAASRSCGGGRWAATAAFAGAWQHIDSR